MLKPDKGAWFEWVGCNDPSQAKGSGGERQAVRTGASGCKANVRMQTGR
jgi:hypothetical protein